MNVNDGMSLKMSDGETVSVLALTLVAGEAEKGRREMSINHLKQTYLRHISLLVISKALFCVEKCT